MGSLMETTAIGARFPQTLVCCFFSWVRVTVELGKEKEEEIAWLGSPPQNEMGSE